MVVEIGKDCWNIIQTYHTQLKYNDVMKELKKTWIYYQSNCWNDLNNNYIYHRRTNIKEGYYIYYCIHTDNKLYIGTNMDRVEIILD